MIWTCIAGAIVTAMALLFWLTRDVLLSAFDWEDE